MCSKILSPSSISELASGSEKALIKFDSHGLPPAPGEDFPEYAQRMSRLAGALDELEKELSGKKTFEVAPGIKIADNARLPQKIYSRDFLPTNLSVRCGAVVRSAIRKAIWCCLSSAKCFPAKSGGSFTGVKNLWRTNLSMRHIRR